MEQAATNGTSRQNTPEFKTSSETQSDDSVTPISEFVARPDFPECSRGATVNIGGYTGVVVDIVGNSLKVRSEETTMSYNCHSLRRLYGPREEKRAMSVEPVKPESAPEASRRNERRFAAEDEPEPEAPKRNIITEPNYTVPVKLIREFTGRPDFPQCTFGEYVDIGDYKGVVVEIVKGSLKVRSPEEVIRSYNSQVLRKLYPADKS